MRRHHAGAILLAASILAAADGYAMSRFAGRILGTLPGHSTCELPSQSRIGQFVLPMNGGWERALEYRKSGSVKMVFVLGHVDPTTLCGTIIGALRLPKHHGGEAIEFDCYLANARSNTDHVIGLANNRRGKLRYVVPRRAWRVNLELGTFEPITNKRVVCDTAGYA